MKKRFLAVLLALTLLLGLTSGFALADDSVNSSTPAGTSTAAPAGTENAGDANGTVDVRITMNAVSTAMTLTDSTNKTIDVGTPTDSVYDLHLKSGDYTITGYDSTTVNGTLGLTVTGEAQQSYQVWTVTNIYATNSGLTYGTDYTAALRVSDSANSARPATLGWTKNYENSRAAFLCYEADTAAVTFTPSVANSDSYMATTVSGTQNGNKSWDFSAALPAGNICTFTVPSENCKLRVGTLSTYYIYTDLTPTGSTANENGTVTYTYQIAYGTTVYYRVSDPTDDSAVTYWNWVRPTAAAAYTVNAADMRPSVGTNTATSKTVSRDLSLNTYDVASVLMTLNPAGYLNLTAGSTQKFECFRNWQAIEGIMNSQTAEPDYHYTVIAADGSASDVVSVVPDASNSGIATITANKTGTAIVLVTYDAMINQTGMGGKFFSAIWPENTGVFVVSVGADGTGIAANMNLNTGKNTTDNKLSGDTMDSQIDTLYYYGSGGASYSFTPESGTTVSVLRPTLTANSLTYSGWNSTDGVTDNNGTYTVSGLTEGKNIIRVTKGDVSNYQVVTAKRLSYTLYSDAACTTQLSDTASLTTGSTFYIRYSTVYMPANKMAGIYNMSGTVCLTDTQGGTFKSTPNQYAFASTAAAQTVKVMIPKYLQGNTYTLGGSVLESGYGSPYGSHRGTTYETGRNPNFSASVRVAYLGNLPDISLTITPASFATARLNIVDSEKQAVPGCTLAVKDTDGNSITANEDYRMTVIPGTTYNYVVNKAGYRYQTGSFTVPSDETGTYTADVSLTASSASAWDGLAQTEPTQSNGVYQIGTGAELAWFAASVNSGAATSRNAVLTADIDLAGYPWTHIGDDSKTYSGVFDGQSHSVNNLYVNSTDSFSGLFGSACGVIKNLTVNGTLTTTNGAAAGIVGYLNNGTNSQPATIENCVSNVNISFMGSSGSNLGGIAGYTNSSAAARTVIRNCVNNGNINGGEAAQSVGGIAGYSVGSNVLIDSCKNNGAIKGTSNIGGICGNLPNGNTLINCENFGTVSSACTAATEGAGGIAGNAAASSYSSSKILIFNCANHGAVMENGTGGSAGGILGTAALENAATDLLTVNNVYNNGAVTAANSGGIIGYVRAKQAEYPAVLTNCYNEGTAVKGIVGNGALNTGTVSNANYLSVSNANYLSTATAGDSSPASKAYTRDEKALTEVTAELNHTVAAANSPLYRMWTTAETYAALSAETYTPRTVSIKSDITGTDIKATSTDVDKTGKTYSWYQWTEKPADTSLGGVTGKAVSADADGSEYGWMLADNVWQSDNQGKDKSTSTLNVSYTVQAGDKINFSWKVSSEEDYDFLSYYVDGTQKDKISGATDWATVTISGLTEGKHTVTFTFAKDDASADGADTAWVKLNANHYELEQLSETGDTLATPADSSRVYCTVTYSDGITVASRPLTLGSISVTVAAYDYTAAAGKLNGASATGVVMEKTVTVPADATASEVIAKAFADGKVDVHGVDKGYVSSVGALSGGTGGGYSGWCFGYYNASTKTFDDFSNMGFTTLASLNDGDRLEFHYSVNPDGNTDDIGDGWYGKPIMNTFKLADGQRVTLSKKTTYDNGGNAATAYYINQGNQYVPMHGSGTADDPFILSTTITIGASAAVQTAVFTTDLNSHYYTVTDASGNAVDLSQPHDYSGGFTFRLSSMGGNHVSYYKVTAANASGESSAGSTITVSFRLIGATKSSAPVNYSTGTCDSSYVTWISTTSYAMSRDATVGELFTKALGSAGLTYTGLEKNYISAVTAPQSVGGYRLAEFTNGDNSGWMYTVNGTHPQIGLNDCTLRDGDVVVWHYVNDYAYEVKDWYGGTKGTNTTWNLWLKAADTVPSTGGAAAANAASGTVIEQAATVSGTTATAVIPEKSITDAISAAKKSGDTAITIAPTGADSVTSVSVTLPRSAAKAIVDDASSALVMETIGGSVTLPNDALSSIVSQASGSNVKITVAKKTAADVTDKTIDTQNALIVEVTVASDGKNITAFGGKSLTVSIPVNSSYTDGASYKVIIISADGKTETVTGKCVKKDGRLAVEIGTAHLSTFIVTNMKAMSFTDVSSGAWYYDAVEYACENGLFNGTSDTNFSPDAAMTRAMLVTVLYRMEGKPAVTGTNGFTDVENGEWYTDAVRWAGTNKIVSGYGGELFGTNDSITREQLAAILYNYAKSKGYDVTKTVDLKPYTDVTSVDTWATDAMKLAVGTGLISGTSSTTLSPNDGTTRAQVATILMRFAKNIAK